MFSRTAFFESPAAAVADEQVAKRALHPEEMVRLAISLRQFMSTSPKPLHVKPNDPDAKPTLGWGATDRELSIGQLYPGVACGSSPVTYIVHIYSRNELLRRAEQVVSENEDELQRDWFWMNGNRDISIPPLRDELYEHATLPRAERLEKFKGVSFVDFVLMDSRAWIPTKQVTRVFSDILTYANAKDIPIAFRDLKAGLRRLDVQPIISGAQHDRPEKGWGSASPDFYVRVPLSEDITNQLPGDLVADVLSKLSFRISNRTYERRIKDQCIDTLNRHVTELKRRCQQHLRKHELLRPMCAALAREYEALAHHSLVKDHAQQFVLDISGNIIAEENPPEPDLNVGDKPPREGAYRVLNRLMRKYSLGSKELGHSEVIGIHATLFGRASASEMITNAAAPLPDLTTIEPTPDTHREIWNGEARKYLTGETGPAATAMFSDGAVRILNPLNSFDPSHAGGFGCSCGAGYGNPLESYTVPNGDGEWVGPRVVFGDSHDDFSFPITRGPYSASVRIDDRIRIPTTAEKTRVTPQLRRLLLDALEIYGTLPDQPVDYDGAAEAHLDRHLYYDYQFTRSDPHPLGKWVYHDQDRIKPIRT